MDEIIEDSQTAGKSAALESNYLAMGRFLHQTHYRLMLWLKVQFSLRFFFFLIWQVCTFFVPLSINVQYLIFWVGRSICQPTLIVSDSVVYHK